MKDTYLIDYEAKDSRGVLLKAGLIKVKNKDSELHAKTSLEDYLRRNLRNFDKLIVKKCVLQNDIFDIAKNIFGPGFF